ncbi:type IV pilin protein [Stutzerimonas tarimensis]|uniref:Type IV pilin protein n=1 Tax=Stutzerimonas tarimensis TaxID=1507735 RepID=A0ABV7TBJ9_9GAMM
MRQNGFTLIEMMIAVAILGVLVAIAYPSYTEHVSKGKRAEAKAALMEAAQNLERYFSVNGSYVDSGGDLPSVYATSVPVSGAANYRVQVVGTPARNTFVLEATRAGSMSSDACGDFRINQAGAKSLGNNTRPVDDCW